MICMYLNIYNERKRCYKINIYLLREERDALNCSSNYVEMWSLAISPFSKLASTFVTSHRPQVIWNKKVFIPRLMAHYNLLALYRLEGQEEKEKKRRKKL